MWFERNVMYSVCIRFECCGRVTDMGFQKKKYLDRGVGGWVELYPNVFCICGIFLTLQSPLLGLQHLYCDLLLLTFESILAKMHGFTKLE